MMRTSFGASAFTGLLALSLPLLGGCSHPDEPDGPIGTAGQRLSQCVTIQRGTFGNVEDATISSGVTAPNWSPGSLRAGGQVEALLRFDVSSIPASATIDSATLSITTASPVSNQSLWARHASAAWSEPTVTFASFNQQMNNKIAGSMIASAPSTTLTMTIKPATVQGWVDGSIPNYGLVLETMVSAPSFWKDTVFVSSESPTVASRPALQVCFTPVNYCASAPCQNGGTCTSGSGGYTCACAPGYTGTNCEININDCSGGPCQNGGTCTDGVNSYSCACAPGYTGTNCEIDINECAPLPCQNGGVCTDHVNAYSCACPAGFTGTNCEINIDDCAGGPCQNGGTCADGVNGYTCSCAPGFTGQNCQTNIDDCVNNACQNGATCVDGIATYTCSCAPGFTGALCEVNIDDCAGGPCQNGGTCADGVNGYTCSCAAGYTGVNCEIDINDCLPNPCQNGGTCVDGVNSYSCQCASGWSGVNCDQPAVVQCPCSGGYYWEAALLQSPKLLTRDDANGVTWETNSGTAGYLSAAVIDGEGVCEGKPDNGNLTYMAPISPAEAQACMDILRAWGAGPCTPNPCQNGGYCAPQGSVDYTCYCTTFWTGTICDQPRTEFDCDAYNPCSPEAWFSGQVYYPASAGPSNYIECTSPFSCEVQTCAPGTTWDQAAHVCQISDPCATNNPCAHGTCAGDGQGGTTCTCDPFWLGAICDQPACPCQVYSDWAPDNFVFCGYIAPSYKGEFLLLANADSLAAPMVADYRPQAPPTCWSVDLPGVVMDISGPQYQACFDYLMALDAASNSLCGQCVQASPAVCSPGGQCNSSLNDGLSCDYY